MIPDRPTATHEEDQDRQILAQKLVHSITRDRPIGERRRPPIIPTPRHWQSRATRSRLTPRQSAATIVPDIAVRKRKKRRSNRENAFISRRVSMTRSTAGNRRAEGWENGASDGT